MYMDLRDYARNVSEEWIDQKNEITMPGSLWCNCSVASVCFQGYHDIVIKWLITLANAKCVIHENP